MIFSFSEVKIDTIFQVRIYANKICLTPKKLAKIKEVEITRAIVFYFIVTY